MSDEVRCPNCAERIKRKAIMCRFCQRGLSEKHFKKCRFCGEMVRLSSSRCRFCMSGLSEPPPNLPPGPTPGSQPGPDPHGAPVPRPSSGDPQGSSEIALALPEPDKELETPAPKKIGDPAGTAPDSDPSPVAEDEVECPCCAELIRREAILCRFCQSGLSSAEFRKCMSCGEKIRAVATYCRYCNSTRPFLPDRFMPYVAPAAAPDKPSSTGWGFVNQENLKRLDPRKAGEYGAGVRAQVFEVIVRQAMAGAPWREICAGPMQVNNISPQEVMEEVRRRKDLLDRPGS